MSEFWLIFAISVLVGVVIAGSMYIGIRKAVHDIDREREERAKNK